MKLNYFQNLESKNTIQDKKKNTPKPENENQTRIDKFLVATKPNQTQENLKNPQNPQDQKQKTKSEATKPNPVSPQQFDEAKTHQKNHHPPTPFPDNPPKKPNQPNRIGSLQEKIRKFSSKSPPKLPTNNKPPRKQLINKQNKMQHNNTGTGTKQETTQTTTRDTRTLMELIKQKQAEKQQQQQQAKQLKQTKQKQNATTVNKQDKTRKPENVKQNLPKITMYLTKKTNNIEARAAAFNSNDNQSNVTNIASKDITSASSRDNNQSDGMKTGLQTKPGDAAKGLPI